jgi:hypothetical protein
VATALVAEDGNRAPADTTRAPAPFEPTGWKTVWFGSSHLPVHRLQESGSLYAAVMGWKVRDDDGSDA